MLLTGRRMTKRYVLSS